MVKPINSYSTYDMARASGGAERDLGAAVLRHVGSGHSVVNRANGDVRSGPFDDATPNAFLAFAQCSGVDRDSPRPLDMPGAITFAPRGGMAHRVTRIEIALDAAEPGSALVVLLDGGTEIARWEVRGRLDLECFAPLALAFGDEAKHNPNMDGETDA